MILVKHTVFYRLSLWFGSIKENEFGGAWNIGKIISCSIADPEIAEGQERGYWVYHDQFIFIKATKFSRLLFLQSYQGAGTVLSKRKAKK